LWRGIYRYPRGEPNPPVRFELFLLHNESTGTVEGRVREPKTFGQGSDPWLHATVNGVFDPKQRILRFAKQYDGTNKVDHAVSYRAEVAVDGRRATGTWSIPDVWSGNFEIWRDRK
jgi:hypothetical protein